VEVVMEYRELGKTGIKVSAVAFGAWAIGGPGQWGWGQVDDRESIAAIHRALDLGVTLIDTADAYGAGHSEEVVGRALGPRRKEVVLASKFGIVVDAQGNEAGASGSRDYVMRACEASLRRLGTDYIDLYQMHTPDDKTPLEETMTALTDLRAQGKIRAIGVSNFSVAQLEEAARHADLTSDQPPYSLFRREIEADVLPWCVQHGLGVLAYAPMAHGLLSGTYRPGRKHPEGDWRAHDPHFQGETLARNLKVVERLRSIAAASGHTVAQLAIAWVLARSPALIALAGARRAEQIEETAAAADWRLTADEVRATEAASNDAVPVLV
jgi:aryl-alcohol dehydrogenase-like predicted oxidoreductase